MAHELLAMHRCRVAVTTAMQRAGAGALMRDFGQAVVDDRIRQYGLEATGRLNQEHFEGRFRQQTHKHIFT